MSDAPTETREAVTGERVLLILEERPRVIPLPGQGRVTLGRSSSAGVLIDDPSVSRRHVELILEPSAARVVDLESKNGARVAGRSLEPGVPVDLPFGVLLEVGDVGVLLQPGHRALDTVVARLAPAPPSPTPGVGAAMRRIRTVLARVAPDDVSVLLLGETGVGKELLAAAIHEASHRARGPFVKLNCAAMTETLFESELFGHEKGAFTGAVSSKGGLLEAARGGTVFLDEVGELPPASQSKLLRALEQRVVRRVGGRADIPIDVRFVSATNRELEVESARGTFRSDLYFRLSGFTIRVPPLRARLDELAGLAEALLESAAHERKIATPRLSAAALAALTAHPWPGNVRELKNVLVHALILCDGSVIDASDLPLDEMRARARQRSDPKASDPDPSPPPAEPDADARDDIERALRESGGNQTEAARLLGISRRTLINRLDALAIARPRKGR